MLPAKAGACCVCVPILMIIRLLLHACLAASFVFGQVVPGRYLLELSEEPVARYLRGRRPAAQAVEQRRSIDAEQRVAIRAAQLMGGRVRTAVDTVMNAVAVEMSGDDAGAEIARLSRLPVVRRVYEVRIYRSAMDRALVLHRVTEAWTILNGSENAGAGMKIAILDSGIDATHPSFQDATLTPPVGFPKVSKESNSKFVNSKVIVARSYEELAARIGQPTAVRAVANANGQNRVNILIPCHRVIGKNGDLTGYGGGLWRKRFLLERERYQPR